MPRFLVPFVDLRLPTPDPRRAAAAAALVLACWPAAAVAQEPAETVALRFGWQAGAVAEVRTTRVRIREAEFTDTLVGEARYRLSVRSHPEGLRITYDSIRVGASGDGTGPSQPVHGADVAASYVVNEFGDFVEVADPAGYAAGIRALLGEVLPEPGGADAADGMLDAMLSETALAGMAGPEWDALVGTWAGADVDLGAVYHITSVAPVPMLPGATVPMMSDAAVARVRCGDPSAGAVAPGALECVRLHITTRPDPQAMRLVLDGFVSRLGSEADRVPVFEELVMETEVIVVARPESLLPEHATITMSVRGTLRIGEERSALANLDRRTASYRWRD